jgi:hypothetical protein
LKKSKGKVLLIKGKAHVGTGDGGCRDRELLEETIPGEPVTPRKGTNKWGVVFGV